MVLEFANFTGLGSQEYTTQLIFLEQNNNLTINGTYLSISNNQASNAIIRSAGTGNQITIEGEIIYINNNIVNDYGVFYINSYNIS